jgi:hypothetical protein
MVWLAGVVAYEQAAQVFARIGHCAIPASSIWRVTQAYGDGLQTYEQKQQQQVRPERLVLPPAGLDHHQRKGVSLDGGKMHLRGEGWKEFKVGTVYDIALVTETDPETKEDVEVARGVNMAYQAVLGSVEEFGPALWTLAVAHDVPQAAEVAVTADGAEWIWNLTDDYFPDSVQIVDWYHATEHLAQAAGALYGADEAAAQRWQQARRDDLYLGAVDKITTPLLAANLSSLAQYFQTHDRRMQYQEFREGGYPIGSGTVESGIKRFKHRLSGPGMRWSRPAAERMLVIRAAIMTGDFDDRWRLALN